MKKHLRSLTHVLLPASALAAGFWLAGGPITAQPHACHCDNARMRYFDQLLPRNAPGSAGQDSLGAIQEVTGLLLADPMTNWEAVSIHRVERHLRDLNNVVENADVEERPISGGVEIILSGPEAVVAAASRVVAEHARRLDGFRGWRVAADEEAGTLRLTLTAGANEVAVLRGLGFYGFLASGVRPHDRHMALANGKEMPPPYWQEAR